MTNLQENTLYELARLGYHQPAADAEEHWGRGLQHEFDSDIKLPGLVRQMVNQANWEQTQLFPNVARIRGAQRRPEAIESFEQTTAVA